VLVLKGRRSSRYSEKTSGEKDLRPVWLAGILLAWLLGANVAAADEIIEIAGLDVSIPGDLSTSASDLEGWFSNGDTQQPFPAELDPSQPWTSAANIATMDYWLSLVMELGNDPSLLTELYGLGMITSPDPATVGSANDVSQGLTQENLNDVSEPRTLGLFLGGLALLAFARQHRLTSSR
jgi:hypothetical protein